MSISPTLGAADGAYGARPVSVDIARGRTLAESPHPDVPWRSATTASLPLSYQVAADRLSLAHWPRGHQIFVCAIAGGTGRTTMAGLLATVLAELPYAQIWPPVALLDGSSRSLSSTAKRWNVLDPGNPDGPSLLKANSTRSGVHSLASTPSSRQREELSVLIIDEAVALPSDLSAIRDDPTASVLLMTRPDRASLAEAAEALVWMNDHSSVSRRQVTVAINHGVGQADRGSKPAALALGIRCAAIHSLPSNRALAPGRVLPSGRDLPERIRRIVSRMSLDIWSATPQPAMSITHHEEQQ